MKNKIVLSLVIVVIFGIILSGLIYTYAIQSDGVKFATREIESSSSIQRQVGHVKNIKLNILKGYDEKFVDDERTATMVLDIAGDKGNFQANVSVTKENGIWKIDQLFITPKE